MDETGRGLSHLFPVPIGAQSPPLIDTAPFSGLDEEPLSAVVPTEELISELFHIMREVPSPPQSESDLQILPTLQAPSPHLEDSTSTPSRDERKSRENLNSGAQFKCPVCTKGFNTDKAMFGHMWKHPNRGRKGLKKPSVTKPKPRPIIPDLCNKLTASWTVTKKRNPREVPKRKIPAEVKASILTDLSKSTLNSQSEKSTMAVFAPLEEEVAAILVDMPNLIRNCVSQKRRMLQSARLENKKRRKNAVSLVPVKLQGGEVEENSDMKAHVCEICGKDFEFGYQLGGHKRAHYQ